MNKTKKIVGIIPARGGSKGVPRKNINLLDGKPLIAYSIEAAMQSGIIDRVIVSTEDEEIADAAKEYGAEVLMRPAALAKDEIPTEPVMLHALQHLEETDKYQPEIVMLLQATSPLRNARHIQEALSEFIQKGCDSLLSVCPSHAFLWKNSSGGAAPVNYDFRNRPRRQDSEPEYQENGAIYLTDFKVFLTEQTRLGGKIGLYVMSAEDSLEIDSPLDFWLCEQVLKNKNTR